MMRAGVGVAVALVGIAAIAWGSAGAAQDRSAQKVGEKIDQAVDKIQAGVKEASSAIRERFARARTTVHDMGVEARIYGRLHWDKALYDAKIDLEVRKDGVTTLRGTVPNAAAKQKAVALARETVGVTEVIDQLTLGTTTPPATPVEPDAAGARPRP